MKDKDINIDDPAWLTMNDKNEVELHTTKPIPLEHVFRTICGVRRTIKEREANNKDDENECET